MKRSFCNGTLSRWHALKANKIRHNVMNNEIAWQNKLLGYPIYINNIIYKADK